jgi:threonine/homoserine/homoserine lactone efflux protein
MHKYTTILCWGFAISFIGTLPIGTLNSTIAVYAINQLYSSAILFALAAVLVEVVMVRLLLTALHQLPFFKAYVKWFNIVALLVLYALAFVSIQAAIFKQAFTTGLPVMQQNAFVYGFILSAINPLHIPFWLGWTAVLKAKNILQPQPTMYNAYVLAIGIGTLVAFTLYAVVGTWLVAFLQHHTYLLNWLVGLSLLGTAIWQTMQLIKQKQHNSSLATK